LEELKNYPLFTINDITRIKYIKPEYAKLVIYRLKKNNLIKEIEKGKYTCHDDPYIFASQIIYPSYISMWSAFAFNGLTEQIIKEINIIGAVSKKDINIFNTRISFTKSKNIFGYEKINYNGFEVFIADIEKAIIDSLIYFKCPLDEIKKAIANSKLDMSKINNYLKILSSSSLNKRLGFLLEEYGYNSSNLLKNMDYNYILLDKLGNEAGEKNKKWRLILNDR
ncbi:MAG: hypothetical protein KKF44_10685, partial [Nanoarchaeota archaeon]|nr:hypothetical protein [Nanoarchaeota archaeon]